jgi:hypothetical protein
MTIEKVSLPPTPSDPKTRSALERTRSKINEVVDKVNPGGGLVEGAGLTKITVGVVAPANPSVGDLWIDPSTLAGGSGPVGDADTVDGKHASDFWGGDYDADYRCLLAVK